MTRSRGVLWIIVVGAGMALAPLAVPILADDEKPAAPTLTVVDAKGKKITLNSWTFTAGIMRLSWLPDKADKKPDDKKAKEDKDKEEKAASPRGPEALAFREEKSTDLENGILTLVPLTHIRGLDYDNDKKIVTLTALNSEGKDQALTGSTKYRGINKLSLEAEEDLGELGKAAVKFQGGALDKGIRSLRFSQPKPAPALAGRAGTVIALDKEKHAVHDLMPLYSVGEDELKLLPTLFFKTTVKIDVSKIKKLEHVEADGGASRDFRVTLASGKEHTLTLLTSVELADKRPAALQGLVGRVSVGYKLFPIHTVSEVQFETKRDKEREKEKKKDETSR